VPEAIGDVLYNSLNLTVILDDLHKEGLDEVTNVEWSTGVPQSDGSTKEISGNLTLQGISVAQALELATRNSIETIIRVEIANILGVHHSQVTVTIFGSTTTTTTTTPDIGLRGRVLSARLLAPGDSVSVGFSVQLGFATTSTTTPTTTTSSATTPNPGNPVTNGGAGGVSDTTVIGLSVAGGILFLVLIGLIIGFVLMRAHTAKRIREITDQSLSVTSHVQVETKASEKTPRRASKTPSKQKKNISLEDWIDRNGLHDYRDLLGDLGVKRVADILLLVPSDFKSMMSFDEGRRLIQSAREAVGDSKYDTNKLRQQSDSDSDSSSSSSSSSSDNSKKSKKSKKGKKKKKRKSVASSAAMNPRDLRAKRRESRRARRNAKRVGSSHKKRAVQKWVSDHKLGDEVLSLLTTDFGVEHLSDLKLLEKSDFINQGMSKSVVKKVWKAIQTLD